MHFWRHAMTPYYCESTLRHAKGFQALEKMYWWVTSVCGGCHGVHVSIALVVLSSGSVPITGVSEMTLSSSSSSSWLSEIMW